MLGRLKFWLVVGLLASNLAVGVLSLYSLHSISERYASLLERSFPLINNLRLLTRELGTVQRLARRVVDPESEPAWKLLRRQMEEASNAAQGRATDVSAMDLLRDTHHAATIRQVSREYDEKADHFLELIRAGRFAEAGAYNTTVLRPAYDSYMRTLDSAAYYVERQGSYLRASYAEDSRLFSTLLLVFAGWPVLVALLGGLLLFLLVLALIVAVFAPGLSWHSKPTMAPPAP